MRNVLKKQIPALEAELDRISETGDVHYVRAEVIELGDQSVSIKLAIVPWNDTGVIDTPVWTVSGRGVARVLVDTLTGPRDDLEVVDDCPELWAFNEPNEALFFGTGSENPSLVIGDLHSAHIGVAGDHIPFEFHMPLSSLFRDGGGLLKEGPRPLLDAYERILSDHGMKPSRLPRTDRYAYWDPEASEYVGLDGPMMLGRFGAVQVVASGFSAERIE